MIFRDRPLPRIDDLVQFVVVILAFVRSAKRAYANLDEAATGLCFVPSERCELIDRPADRGTRTGDDVRASVHKIVHFGVDLLKPWPVVIVSLVLQAVDNSRPIKSRSAIVSIFRIGQVYLCLDLAVGDLDVREISRREKSKAEKSQ